MEESRLISLEIVNHLNDEIRELYAKLLMTNPLSVTKGNSDDRQKAIPLMGREN